MRDGQNYRNCEALQLDDIEDSGQIRGQIGHFNRSND